MAGKMRDANSSAISSRTSVSINNQSNHMSIQTDHEEKRDTYNALLNCRSDLAFLEKKRDAFEGDHDEPEYEEIVCEITELERRIEDFEYELGLD